MKQIATLTFLILFLTPLRAQDQTVYTIDNLPRTHLADRTQYVTDPAAILSPQARDTINSTLYKLEQQTGIQSVAAVVPSIGQADCFGFAHELLNSWGVGQKGRDNGLVVLLVIDQRCIQFYNGYGLEGDLPDAISKRIQTRVMLPYLKNGDWDTAMVSGIKALYNRLSGSMENDEDNNDAPGAGAWISLIILAILFIILIAGRRGGGGGAGPFIGGMLGGMFGGRGGGGGGGGFGGGGSFGGGMGGGGGAGTRF